MLLEAPQAWRTKRYNVLETDLVYKDAALPLWQFYLCGGVRGKLIYPQHFSVICVIYLIINTAPETDCSEGTKRWHGSCLGI